MTIAVGAVLCLLAVAGMVDFERHPTWQHAVIVIAAIAGLCVVAVFG